MYDRRCGSSHFRHHTYDRHAHHTAFGAIETIQSDKTTRSTVSVCLHTVFGQHKLPLYDLGATETAFAVSSQFRKNTAITHTISESQTCIIVLSPLNSNVPHQARLFSHSACFVRNCPSERCLNIVASSTHHPPTYAANPTSAVTYILPRS